MFKFTDKAGIKVDDLLIFDHDKVIDYAKKHQDLLTDINVSKKTSKTIYGYNQYQHLIKIAYAQDAIEKIVLLKEAPRKKRIKMTITYDGSGFHGFQIQAHERTVQGQMSRVISQITGDDILVQGASRTDALVHAREQVIHFDTDLDIPAEKWLEICNHQLPKDIYLRQVEFVHPLFHARYDVYQKTYLYQIHMGPYNPFLANYYWFQKDLDIGLMKKALKKLEGSHNFASFSKDQEGDLVRTIYHTDIIKKDDVLTIKIVGNGFLRYMVRIIIHYLVSLGQGKVDVDIERVLDMRNRQVTNQIAPPQGLYLESIDY